MNDLTEIETRLRAELTRRAGALDVTERAAPPAPERMVTRRPAWRAPLALSACLLVVGVVVVAGSRGTAPRKTIVVAPSTAPSTSTTVRHGASICANPPPPNATTANVEATISSPLGEPSIVLRNGSGSDVTAWWSPTSLFLVGSDNNVTSVGTALTSAIETRLAPGQTTTIRALPPNVSSCTAFSAGGGTKLSAGDYQLVGMVALNGVVRSTDAVPVHVDASGALRLIARTSRAAAESAVTRLRAEVPTNAVIQSKLVAVQQLVDDGAFGSSLPRNLEPSTEVWFVVASGPVTPAFGNGSTGWTWGAYGIDVRTRRVVFAFAGKDGSVPTYFATLVDHG